MKLFDAFIVWLFGPTQPVRLAPVVPVRDLDTEVATYRAYLDQCDTIERSEATKQAYENDRMYARGGVLPRR